MNQVQEKTQTMKKQNTMRESTNRRSTLMKSPLKEPESPFRISISYNDVKKMNAKQKDEWAARILNYDKEVTEYVNQTSKRTLQVADRLHNTKMDIEDLVEDVLEKKADQEYRMNQVYIAKGMSIEDKHHKQKFDIPDIKDMSFEKRHDGMSRAYYENHPDQYKSARERAKKKEEEEKKELEGNKAEDQGDTGEGQTHRKTVLKDYKKFEAVDPKREFTNLGMGMTN